MQTSANLRKQRERLKKKKKKKKKTEEKDPPAPQGEEVHRLNNVASQSILTEPLLRPLLRQPKRQRIRHRRRQHRGARLRRRSQPELLRHLRKRPHARRWRRRHRGCALAHVRIRKGQARHAADGRRLDRCGAHGAAMRGRWARKCAATACVAVVGSMLYSIFKLKALKVSRVGFSDRCGFQLIYMITGIETDGSKAFFDDQQIRSSSTSRGEKGTASEVQGTQTASASDSRHARNQGDFLRMTKRLPTSRSAARAS
eukprot:scaffold500_cov162-Pinguiococcus_pyrenoidosus.AAC.2